VNKALLYKVWILLIALVLFTSVQRTHAMQFVPDASLLGSIRDSVMHAETFTRLTEVKVADSLAGFGNDDKILHAKADSLLVKVGDTLNLNRFNNWTPDPIRSMWLGMVVPGGGQIYNRKYWKLPIVYGGLLGCVYALNWNNTMYQDYSQAYVDIMDDDPNTKSYENFIPPSYNINQNMTRMQDLFKRKKNYYRRYRDLSIFCMIGVYALSILDAYVDAELSSFDISKDLSMKVKPAIINDKNSMVRGNVLKSSSYGLQCSFNF
jgi:hypothetical protein